MPRNENARSHGKVIIDGVPSDYVSSVCPFSIHIPYGKGLVFCNAVREAHVEGSHRCVQEEDGAVNYAACNIYKFAASKGVTQDIEISTNNAVGAPSARRKVNGLNRNVVRRIRNISRRFSNR